MLLALSFPLSAVDYDGEKSFLFEAQYQVCVIPPQVDDAVAKGVNVVSVDEAKALYDQDAKFFDARAPRHYHKARIKGAHLVKFDQSKGNYIAVELPKAKDEPVVFYCYGESCANSYEAALAVRKSGYTNVHWLLNGFGKWQRSNYPVESSEK
jgi:rhodanese-related sulfurtransferase